MGIKRHLLERAFAIYAAMQAAGALAAPVPINRHQLLVLQQTIVQADRRGDFTTAAMAAEQCVAINNELSPGHGRSNSSYCRLYLATALRHGKGIARDEARAFSLVKNLAVHDLDNDAVLDLAEDYLDGSGTPRDPVEAAVLVWRFDHGFWSSYGPCGGMCDDCGAMWAHAKALDMRLAQELTATEKANAASIEAARFPEVERHVKTRDREVLAIAATFFAAVCGGVWLSLRRRRVKPRLA